MFFKMIRWEGDPGLRDRVETIYQCEKVIHFHRIDGGRRILLEPIREILVDPQENVGLFIMNDEGRTIEVIQHLEELQPRLVATDTLAGSVTAGQRG
jgi:hypothetical protein